MQFQDALVDTMALTETLLKILKDIEDRMDAVARKATPVMAACGSYLLERRHEVYYWLDRESLIDVLGSRDAERSGLRP